jgi:hypothetical protein
MHVVSRPAKYNSFTGSIRDCKTKPIPTEKQLLWQDGFMLCTLPKLAVYGKSKNVKIVSAIIRLACVSGR